MAVPQGKAPDVGAIEGPAQAVRPPAGRAPGPQTRRPR